MSTPTWEPNPQTVQKIIEFAAYPEQNDLELNYLKQQHDINNHFVFILCRSLEATDSLRETMSKLLIENINLESAYRSMTPYLKSELLLALGNGNAITRTKSAEVIAHIVTNIGLEKWDDLFNNLLSLLSSISPVAIEGSLFCFSKIFQKPTQPFPQLMVLSVAKKIITFFSNPKPNLREISLSTISQIVLKHIDVVDQIFRDYFSGLMKLKNDPVAAIRLKLCESLSFLVQNWPELLIPELNRVTPYIFHVLEKDEEEIAIEACHFLHFLSHLPNSSTYFKTNLANLLSVLSERMKIQNESTKSRLRTMASKVFEFIASIYQDGLLEILLPELQTRLSSPEWTNKEVAIFIIGLIMPFCFKGISAHLPHLLQLLIAFLSDQNAQIIHSTCWTISKYSSWIIQQPEKKLYFEPVLIALLNNMKDQSNRETLNYLSFAAAKLTEIAQSEMISYIGPITQAISNVLQNMKTQEDGKIPFFWDFVTCFSEAAGSNLAQNEYVDAIFGPLSNFLENFDLDFEKEQLNQQNLENELQNKANTIYDELSNPEKNGENFSTENPNAKNRNGIFWNHQEIPSMLKALDSLIVAISNHEFNENLAQCVVQMINMGFKILQGKNHLPNCDEKIEWISNTLHTLNSVILLADRISSIKDLVFEKLFVTLLNDLMNETSMEIKIAALALFQTAFISFVDKSEEYIVDFIPILISNLDPNYPSICNNTCSVICQILINFRNEIEPYFDEMMEKVIQILDLCNENNSTFYLFQTVSVLVGYSCVIFPSIASKRLDLFLDKWCLILTTIWETKDKEWCFKGLCNIIYTNIDKIKDRKDIILKTIESYASPTDELTQTFQQILLLLRESEN
ncbi:hypothetical protein M0811_03007 [Anaeramoeba ignava]|uniref:Uncharacterized protein n=1 Tax=Anaeramoeba ignava TaxID=1746090 RepID=A0A9Q0L7K4_ANAIG|nr:hypothetical protein M0811_03007 [Anaeramoeba ignava]